MADSLTPSDARSQEKLNLFEQLLRKKGISFPSQKRIRPRERQGSCALSFAQERLWFLAQLEPGNTAYNLPAALRLMGVLDVAAMEGSFNEIIRRHEALRTTFGIVDGQAVQRISTPQPINFPVIDLSRRSEAEREAVLQRLAAAEAALPFDLEQGPLLRVQLLRLRADEHVLLFTMHHIVSDAWSMGVLVREMVALYDAFTRGAPSPLPELEIQYADYAVWQREWLLGAVLERQLAYWKQQLADAPPVLELPTDYLRPAVQSHAGAYQPFNLSLSFTEELQQLGQREGVTLFMILLAAFQTLLFRHTGETEIVVGTSSANRTRTETEGLIGFFVNTLVLRTSLARQPSWRQVLQRVKETAVAAYAHQDTPFEKLVEELRPERHLSHHPVFQVMMELQSLPRQDLELRGLKLSMVETESRVTMFDLMLTLAETNEGIRGGIHYSTELFEDQSISVMGRRLERLLEAMVQDPDQRITQAQMLSERERQQLLFEWNQTQREYPRHLCIQQLFEAQVGRTPHSVAVSCGTRQLTYCELDDRANRVAAHLRRQGVGPEQVVAVVLERGVEFLAAILGIFKAGGAYLPVDPLMPGARMAQVLEHSGCQVMLSREGLLAELEVKLVGRRTGGWLSIEQLVQANPGTEVAEITDRVQQNMPGNLAYIIYTSGSTGTPKGVAITQQGMINHLCAKIHDLALTSEDVVAQTASTSFDISVWQFLASLMVGGQVLIVNEETVRDPHSLVGQMGLAGVTVWETVPSMLRAVLDQVSSHELEKMDRLRWLLVTGEALEIELCRRWRRERGEVLMVNAYGPTECSDDVTHEVIGEGESGSEENKGERVAIGSPVQNTQVYVVDEEIEIVALGVVGEIVIGGDGVGRGYVRDGKETAERFVPDAFSGEKGLRVYRTGDVGRRWRDGRVEYVGRRDEQVKVRGYRIELGEVEAALREAPWVNEAVVIVNEEGERRLVAYVVGADGAGKEGGENAGAVAAGRVGELREHLKGRLPEYMVPSAFVELAEMPLTPNGKVDRRALPAPEYKRSESAEYTAPRTRVEQTLARIWSEVLGVQQVGIHENFFELGGDSILSIQVIIAAGKAGLQFIPRQLFENQTVATLAAVIGQVGAVAAEQGIVSGAVELTPVQHWFFEQEMKDPQHFNQSVMLSVPADLEVPVLAAAVQHLVVRHDALRLRFQRDAGGWQQRNAEAEEHEVFAVRAIAGATAAERARALTESATEVQRSLNLEQGPLLRVVYYEMEEEERGRVLMVIHHLAVDGVSWRILLEELPAIYEQLQRGAAVELPAKSSSYQEWARQLVGYAGSAELQAELSYWTAAEREQGPGLPVDSEGGVNTRASTGVVSVELEGEQTRVLLQEVPQVYHTQINDLLLTALGLTLTRWSGSEAVLVDLEGHGREDLFAAVDVTRTVGWFTSIYPVLLEVSGAAVGDEGVAAALKAVKEQLRAVPRRGIGYGVLRYLSPEAAVRQRLREMRAAEVSFNYLGQVDQALKEESRFGIAAESSGAGQSERGERSYLLEIDAIIAGGRLRLMWSYSQNLHRPETIEALAGQYLEELRGLIAHCQSPQAGGYTPSDFPLAQVTQEWLDQGQRQGWEIEDIYGLSPLQQGLLFHTIYAPELGQYIMQVSCLFTGEINAEALKRAWLQVVERHAVLRSSFHWEEKVEPVQVVHLQVELPFEVKDWRSLPEPLREVELEKYLRLDRERGFELARAPLMRMQLAQVEEQSYWFIWSFHHVLLDGWSLPLLIKEVMSRYEAESRGAPLKIERAQAFRDYIQWLREQDLTKAETYWRQRLKGFSEPTPLPLSRSQEGRRPGDGYHDVMVKLSEAATQRLRHYSRQQQVTMNTVVLAAWALLLSRYSGERDLVYGVTVSGRPGELAGVEEMVGLFINTLPVRVQVRAEQDVGEWLRQLQTEQVEMRQYEYSPLVEVQRWSEVGRGRPLFESILVFENFPVNDAVGEQRTSIELKSARVIEANNYPLTVTALPGQEFGLMVSYDTGRFEEDGIKQVLGHLERLLYSVVRNPLQRIWQLQMLSDAELHQLLFDRNQTTHDYPRQLCLHQLFEMQVERSPDDVALRCADQQLSYHQLNCRANQLARHLQSLGVGPETVVALLIERSFELVIALLGVLKAGAAYLPLDPSYPLHRLSLILDETQPPVLLTQQSLLDDAPTHWGHTLCLDADWPTIATHPTEAVSSAVIPEHLAYVIYTSGSTGRPKGVMIDHRSVVNYLSWCSAVYAVGKGEGSPLHTSVSFDLTVTSLFAPLITGRAVVLLEEERGLEVLSSGITGNENYSLVKLTPAHLEMIRRGVDGGRVEGWSRVLVIGGEALSFESLGYWQEHAPQTRLINEYGPTETVVGCSSYEVKAAVNGQRGTVPIGAPISNVQMYIVDDGGEVVPMGVIGEIVIGGAGVGRGYMRRAEETAERFRPDGYSGESGARVYHSGDLGRYRVDGVMEYIGRRDDQVKVRGYRIELSEVEAVLREVGWLQDAAVVVREKEAGDKRIVAYVVGGAGRVGELREHLKGRLPEYMAPSAFVELAEMPLTPNGKVDRRALPAPEYRRSESAEYTAPRTSVEQTLARIWSEVLGVQQVGIHENFFELGGDSILSIQVIIAAGKAGLQFIPRQLFENQTVATLAAVIGQVGAVAAEQGIVSGAVELTPVQHWFFEQEMKDPQHFNQSVMLSVPADLEVPVLAAAVQHLVVRHDALRLRFQRDAGGWRQRNAEAEEQEVFAVRAIAGATAAERARALTESATEVQRSLNLEQGPLLRVVYYEMEEEERGRVLMVIHHLAVDGVSWRILLEELPAIYEQLQRGAAVELPAKSSSYQEWARQLVGYAGSAELQAELSYWTAPEREQGPGLPVDSEGGANTRASTGVVSVELEGEQTRVLLQEVPQVYHTQINDLLLTALGLTLTRWSESEAVLVDLEGHGREDLFAAVDVTRTVGWFTSIYPVWLEVSGAAVGGGGVAAALKAVKEQLRAVPRRGIGYGVLRYLSPEAAVRQRLREMRAAEVSFNYLGQVDQALKEESRFGIAAESSGAGQSERGERSYLLEIDAIIAGGRLRLMWSYSQNLHRPETIEALAGQYLEELRGLIAHCQSPHAGGYTPSDFPLAQVTQAWLDQGQRQGWEIEDIYGLSPLQQGLLFHTVYAPQAGEYVIQISYRIEGEVNAEALERAWRQVVERHAVLRSSFHWEEKVEPVQVVHRQVELVLDQQDWREMDESAQQQRLERQLSEDRRRGFELHQAPLMRTQLVQTGEQSYWFIWSFHHVLLDGWSLPLLIKEVMSRYEAEARGMPLKMERAQAYRKYIQWLREQDLMKAEAYWRKRLAGFIEPTPLPLSSRYENAPAAEGHRNETIELSEAATERLRHYSRQQQVTLNTVVQAAWALLLWHYTGNHDLVYGATVSGRPAELADVEEMVGLFINTLPVRVQVRAEQEVGDWLRQLLTEQVEMRQYEYSPLVNVQGWSEVARGRALFDTHVVFENYPLETVFESYSRNSVQAKKRGKVQISDVRSVEYNNYPISLSVIPGQKLGLTITYDPSRFEAVAIERMLGHLQRLLEGMARETEQRLWQVQMLSEAEQQQLVSEWNQTRREYPAEVCLHELFEKQVERTPAATALVFGGERLSYEELNGRANQVGRYLQKRGVGPETLVGICMERSVELVVGLLGVLKAGGAYLPLDPAYPAQRVSFMFADSHLGVVLTQPHLRSKLSGAEVELVVLDQEWALIGEESRAAVVSAVRAENAAYVIYTSGSTGEPKAAINTHRAICNRLQWMQEAYELQGGDCVMQKTPYSFDVSVWEFFWPLLSGARLAVALPGGHREVRYLRELIGAEQVTVMHFVPSMLEQFVSEEEVGECTSLRLVISSGEALSGGLVERFKERLGWVELENLYGPTEAAVDVSARRCEWEKKGEVVPIGRPIANVQLYILGPEMELGPVGTVGEIYIGGVAVGRGYQGRAEQTAERFVPDPYGGEAGRRLYRTGDVGRYRQDGELEYVGRVDQQVKLRGYRIELGEIEVVLRGHEGVSEAVVIMRAEESGEQRLVAYVVGAGAAGGVTVGELREYLQERLPEYMAPWAYVWLEELPLTPNGKVDRRALPAPERSRMGAGYVGPRSPVEETVAAICGEVLGVERVGIHDNFFELGGHSLLATQVISRVRNVFGQEIELQRLFEAPTVAGLAQRIEAAQRAGAGLQAPRLEKRAGREPAPLSYAQQRLWFLDQLEPGSSIYNVPLALRLEGALEVEALARSFSEVVRRHEVLRTSFGEVDGQAVQLIEPVAEMQLAVTDLSGVGEAEREAKVKELAEAEGNQGFDLDQGPLLRVKLLRLGAEDHVLLVTMHHIISDGWSMGILTREVAVLYEAYLTEEPSPLPELEVQYADYAVWQREWLQGEVLAQELGYWKQQLAGAPTMLELPTDRARPSVESHRGAYEPIILSPNLAAELKVVCEREGVTLFMSLLAAFQVLLWRYTGQNDVVVGTPIANRTRAETEGLIGLFVNTLALRTSLAGELSWRELLVRVKEVCLGAYAHQDVPFEKLVEELQPAREMNHHPLFQVMVALQNLPQEAVEMKGLTLSGIGVENHTAKFDLLFLLEGEGNDLAGALQYNTELFDPETMRRLLAHYERILKSVTRETGQRLWQVQMLSEAEREQVVREWNQTGREYEKELNLAELFAEQAAARAEAIAVVMGEQQLSYGELDRRANQLAHHLRGLGVTVEVPVGICMERSVEMIVSLVGILKAGGYYVPLDPGLPLHRLALMMEDAEVMVVLTQGQQAEQLPAGGAQLVVVDEQWEEIAQQSERPVENRSGLENLAYVSYTSGSTGRPKGVSIRQRGVRRLIQGPNYAQLSAEETLLQLAPLAFDASTFEIWGSLLNGGRLVVMGAEQPSLAELGAVIEEQGVTTLWLTAGLFHLMVDEQLERLGGVRQMVAGGEVLSVSHVERMRQRWPSSVVINGYGPTENTTFTTCHRVGAAEELGNSVPIGRAITNTEVYVVDEEMEVVAVGVIGELYTGGEGLARGYVKGAEQTAERFVPDGLSGRSGRRLYRTGDLVRYRRAGELEYVGRRDEQVKMRGYRIEMGEVEGVLRGHSGVREAVVIVREDEGEQRLVGYVVMEEGDGGEVEELRQYLRERLPEYMVPAALIALSELPLTVNGKVDRGALPEPASQRQAQSYVGPRTAVEELLSQVWKELLHQEAVGIHDNFFELGGHSLLATQVISRVRQVFEQELPLRTLFEEPSIAGLARSIEAAIRAGEKIEAPPLQRVPREQELPLSFAQQRLWFLDYLVPGSTVYNIGYALRLAGALEVEALARSFSEVVRRHEVLRTRFGSQDGRASQIIEPAAEMQLAVTDLSGVGEAEREAKVRELAEAEGNQGFDLEQGPLLRVKLLRLGAEEHVLLVTMHHIISDGWSMGILTREVAVLYEAYLTEEPSPLPELEVQYADYAVWQREWLQGEVLAQELGYWKQQLAGAPTVLELPTDRPRPSVESHLGGYETFRLSPSLTAELKAVSQREGVTLFMNLLAAFQVLLWRYTGQNDVVVGTPIANRTRAETEGLIGFFVNTLALRTSLAGELSWRELLVRVREVCLGAYAHQDVPFEKLVEELQPAREMSHHPLFQVMVVLQNAPTTADVNMKGLDLSRIEVENHTAKFDLLLVLEGEGPELQGMIEYSAELFEPGTVQRLLDHYERLLAQLVKDPEQRLWQVQMLGDSEREQVLFEWNQERLDFPDDCGIHDLIEAQAQRTPQATALIFGEQRLSYQELNIRANQLAHYLRRLHIGPESLVGVCLQRSPEMVIALLGILKAGGAYVPLDPAYPKERLSLILKDSEAEVLLTQRSLVESLPTHEVKVICLDAEATTLAEQSEQTPKVAMSAHNLAYLIYTSGSTGRPKGAAIEHRSAVAFLHWARQFYSDEELDGVLASTSICFDLSVFELFAPLSWGGKVVLVENALSLGGISEAVRLINTVPSAMAELVRLGAVPETAKIINLAGEPISPALVDQVYEQVGVERIYNLYGPSEDTTYSSVAQVERDGRKSPPIGRAIANTQLYIVDSELELSPVGAYGEICLGGEGLARGYHGRSEQTAERFVPNPYSQQGGRRLYRTGDIGRNRADGVVEYVGRADHQVKVRGYRIELGEVEAVLREQEWVSEAVVLVREDEPGDKRLVAYLVAEGAAEDGTEATASESRLATLRQYAKERLPEYMAPSAYVLLNELPLTPTGKVDRKALPAPERSRSQLAAEYIAPSTNIERTIHAIWQDLLQTEQIGVHDNFFDLGGHSLLLIQVLVRLRAAIGHEVALIEVFQYPTIHALSTHLSRKQDVTLSSQSTEELVEKLKEGKGRQQQRLRKVKSLESQGNLK